MLPQLSEDQEMCYFGVRRGSDNYRHYLHLTYSHVIVMKWWNVHLTAHSYSALGVQWTTLAVLEQIFSPPETLAIVLQLSSQTLLEHDAKPREINSKILSTSQLLTPEKLLYTKKLCQRVLEWKFKIIYFNCIFLLKRQGLKVNFIIFAVCISPSALQQTVEPNS